MRQAERDGGHSTTPPPVESESESTDSELEPEADQAGGPDQEILTAYNQRAAAFAAENPDFSDVVGSLEIPAHVSSAVEQSILAETNGPQIAYELARNPEIVSALGAMTPAQAAAKIGRIAEHLDRQNDFRDETQYDAVNKDVPPDILQDLHRKSRELHQQNPLSDEELQAAQAIFIEPAISKLIISMNAPEIAHHLMRNPHVVARLNGLRPLAAAAELAQIRAELQSEAARVCKSGCRPQLRQRERLPRLLLG